MIAAMPPGLALATLLHETAAFADQAQRIGELKGARRDQRGEFAQAVARDGNRSHRPAHRLPAFAQRGQAGDADRQDGWLGVDRIAQLVFGALEAEAR